MSGWFDEYEPEPDARQWAITVSLTIVAAVIIAGALLISAR